MRSFRPLVQRSFSFGLLVLVLAACGGPTEVQQWQPPASASATAMHTDASVATDPSPAVADADEATASNTSPIALGTPLVFETWPSPVTKALRRAPARQVVAGVN